jgi:Outer membrane protein beta-barrel domain
MKKVITIFFFSFLVSVCLLSQTSVNFSVKAGVNFSRYIYKYDQPYYKEQPQNKSLLAVGIPLEINFGRRFMFQTEINFIQKGYKYHAYFSAGQRIYASDDIILKTNWLEVPFLAKVKLISKGKFSLSPFGGLSLGVGLFGKAENNYAHTKYITISQSQILEGVESQKVKFLDDHGLFDLGLNLGGEIRYENMYLDLRYQLGINDTKSNYYNTWDIVSSKTRGLALTVGYRFYTKTPKNAGSTPQ